MARTNTRKKVNKKKTTRTEKANMKMEATVAPKSTSTSEDEELAFDLTKQTTKADWEAFKKNEGLSMKIGEVHIMTILLKISNQLAEILKRQK